jgi:hypothetical protein
VPSRSPLERDLPRREPGVVAGGVDGDELAVALTKGYRLPVTLSEASRLTGKLSIAGPSGKKLGLAAAPIEVASGVTSGAAGKVTLTLKFSAKAKKKLRRAKSAKLTLQLVAVDAAGNLARLAPRKITLKR